MYYSYVGIEYVAMSFSPARTGLALKLLMRVAGNKEGEGSKGHGIGNEVGMQLRGRWQ
jgi:hypothetical protein